MTNRRAYHRVVLVIAILPFIGIAFAGAVFAVDSLFDSMAGNAFAKIKMGATQQQVSDLLGKPDMTRSCGQYLWWGSDGGYLGLNDGRCVTEARYEHFLSAWGVGYSKDGYVVSKYHYVSE